MRSPTVTIVQPSIIYGGRLRVIQAIVSALNDFGIVPKIVTGRLRINPDKLSERYGRQFRADFRVLPRIPPLPPELYIAVFNFLARRLSPGSDLVINTSNSLLFMKENPGVLNYVFFPRRARVEMNAASIHAPDASMRWLSLAGIDRLILRNVYRAGSLGYQTEVVAMTQFTARALRQTYQVDFEWPVIYPPVDISSFDSNKRRNVQVVTTGRFAPDKRQLAQIAIATRVPDLPFKIVGFTGNQDYFEQCRRAIEERAAHNVTLVPDAPFSLLQTLLGRSKFFFHTMINEPFGLTAVQAIAAGCIPVVHDSGGQKETVPIEELRYASTDHAVEIIQNLLRAPEEKLREMRGVLYENAVQNFSANIFDNQIKGVLRRLLTGHVPVE